MFNISKQFGRALAVWMLTLAGVAHAQFQSLHQFPVTYNISSALDPANNLYYTTTPPLFGFKDQFAPSGVSGCVMGYPELRAQCQTVNGGFGFSLAGYTSYPAYRVFIPAGTTFFGLSGYLSQTVQYAAAVKLGSPPSRMSALTAPEYEAAKLAQNRNSDFAKLLAGEERIVVHDGGGSISLSGIARLTPTTLTTGQWLYVRVLNGSDIAGLGAIYEVDYANYRTGYNATQFGTDGDPVASGGTTPDTGGTTPPPTGGTTLTGISLSKSEWTVGATGATFSIYPVPSTAALPSCTFSPTGILAYSAILPPTSAIAIVNIDTTAAAKLAQAQTSITITCGAQTATFKINQTGTVATATVEEITEANGNISLKLKITRPVSQVTPTAKASYWVGAVIPGSALFALEDEWFYLSTGSTATTYDWKQMIVPNPYTVVFAKDLSVTSENQELMIPLGFTKAEFKAFKIKVHFGYQLNSDAFKQFEYVWDPAQ